MFRGYPTLLFACLMVLVLPLTSQLGAQSEGPPPPARAIPGITAPDAFPRGCVDCHVKFPEMDVRLSTLMKQWTVEVNPKVLTVARAAAPELELRGRHPEVSAALQDIPAACLKCHDRASKIAPPFARMIHAIHLSRGEENHFLTLFQGECTHCHKLDAGTGAWTMASGAEK